MRKRQLWLLMVSLTVKLCESVHRIPCEVLLEEGVQYRKVGWYKVEDDSEQPTGLVVKNLQNNKTVPYRDVKSPCSIDDDLALVIPETEVCTTYICCVLPPLGHRIQESRRNYPAGCQRPMGLKSEQVTDEGGPWETVEGMGVAADGYAAKLSSSGSADAHFYWLVGGLAVASVCIIAMVGVVYHYVSIRRQRTYKRPSSQTSSDQNTL